MYNMKKAIILGSTGSIGTQAVEVLTHGNLDNIEVFGLAAGGANPFLLAKQAEQTGAKLIAVADKSMYAQVSAACKALDLKNIEIQAGMESVNDIAGSVTNKDVVLNGITGAVGLEPTLRAIESGATLALANKESLVVGGAVVAKAQVRPGQVVPVDSEHCAIFQSLLSSVHERGMCSASTGGRSDLEQIILTASGGPFRGLKRKDLLKVKAKDALHHPTWTMGPVVTINSSTLVNKALEVIEAYWLFDVPTEKITPVIHPQSIVHSGVTWKDGSTILQASPPDMKLAIALGISWPERSTKVTKPIDFHASLMLNFEPVDHETFPAITLAKQALRASDTHPAVFNAANEVCVEEFLQENITYIQIVDIVSQVLESYTGAAANSICDVLEADQWARQRTRELVHKAA